MEYTAKMRDDEIAMVHLGTHGSTTYPPKQWHQWSFAEVDYAPEFLLTKKDLGGANHDECVTVLDYSLSIPEAPDGYRLVCQYPAGEQDCPWCGDGTGDDDDGKSPECRRPECKLCEGSGHIYSGEGCQVCVFAPLSLPANFPEGSRLEREPGAPMLWSVWHDDEIIGAGDTVLEAIEDASRQVEEWAK